MGVEPVPGLNGLRAVRTPSRVTAAAGSESASRGRSRPPTDAEPSVCSRSARGSPSGPIIGVWTSTYVSRGSSEQCSRTCRLASRIPRQRPPRDARLDGEKENARVGQPRVNAARQSPEVGRHAIGRFAEGDVVVARVEHHRVRGVPQDEQLEMGDGIGDLRPAEAAVEILPARERGVEVPEADRRAADEDAAAGRAAVRRILLMEGRQLGREGAAERRRGQHLNRRRRRRTAAVSAPRQQQEQNAEAEPLPPATRALAADAPRRVRPGTEPATRARTADVAHRGPSGNGTGDGQASAPAVQQVPVSFGPVENGGQVGGQQVALVDQRAPRRLDLLQERLARRVAFFD